MSSEQPPPPPSGPPAAGWYPDPTGEAGFRYWDGSQWTTQTRGHSQTAAAVSKGGGQGLVSDVQGWWNQQGNWKWWVAGLVALVIVANVAGGTESGDDGSGSSSKGDQASSSDSAEPEVEITPASVKEDGNFWVKLSPGDKVQVIEFCQPGAARQAKADYYDNDHVRAIRQLKPEPFVKKLDEEYEGEYADDYSREESIQDKCGSVAPDIVRDQESARDERRWKRQERQEAATRRKLKNFQATNELARLLVLDELGYGSRKVDGQPRFRSANCDRATCTIEYTESATGSLIGELLGTNTAEDAEESFFISMADLFKVLFRDQKLQSATLVPWGSVISPGGKSSYQPIMRMTCTRSAHNQIDWDAIAIERPDGFKQLCSYSLLVSL